MTDREFNALAKGLKTVYADPKFIADDYAVEIWFKLLNDIPYEIATMAAQKYMQTEKFPPTPADIRRYATQIMSPLSEDLTEYQAWDMVRRAINNGIYGAEEEFNKLPKIVQSVIGSPERIRSAATLEPEDLETVEKSHFMRSFRARVEAHKREQQLNAGLRDAISEIRQKAEPIKVEGDDPTQMIEAVDQDPSEDDFEIPPELLNQLHILIARG